MERARGRLRDVTVLIATAENTFCEQRDINSESSKIELPFPQYMERLQEEKHALTVEVLKYLGLQWVAPPSPPSPPRLQQRHSGESIASFRADELQMPLSAVEEEAIVARDHEQRSPHQIGKGASIAWAEGDPASPQRGGLGEQATVVRGSSRYPIFKSAHPPSHTGGGNTYSSSIAGDSSMGASALPHSAVGDFSSWSQDFTAERAQMLPLDGRQRLTQKDSGFLPAPPPSNTMTARSSLPRLTAAESTDIMRGVARRGSHYRLGEGIAVREDNHHTDDARFRPFPPPSPSLKIPTAGIVRPAVALTFVAGGGSRFAGAASTTEEMGVDIGMRLLGLREAEELSRHSSPTPLKRGSGSTAPDSSSPGSDHSRGAARHAGDVSPGMAKGVLGLRKGRHQISPAVGVVGMKRSRVEEGSSALDISSRGPPLARMCTDGATRDTGSASSTANNLETGRSGEQGKGAGEAAPKVTQACRDVGCHRRPIYAFKGDTKALCCPLHRSKEMVNVRHPLCRHESCFRQPSFGIEGDQRASFCSEHKLPEMINVSSRRCRAPGCLRHPNFGFQGDRRATFCCRHKAPGMMDVVSRRCQHHQCVRRPLYAMTGQRAMFCRTHKDPGMTDVVSRRCNYEEGCDRHPSFGWKHADGKARRCAHHRLEGMESVKVNRRGGPSKTPTSG